MRKRIAPISLALTVMFSACAPDSVTPVRTEGNTDSPSFAREAPASADAYAWMGKYHNDGLAYALVKIKASKKVSKADRCAVGLAALKEFQKTFQKPGGRTPTFDDLTITDGMCNGIEQNLPGVAARDGSVEALKSFNVISSTASDFMNQVSTAVDYTNSVPEYAFAVAKIENAASATLGAASLETGSVYGTGSIGVSSENYWTTNGGSWSSDTQLQYLRGAVVPGLGHRYVIDARLRKIIRADIAAAIGALVYDWWMGEVAVEKAAIKAAAASMIAAISLF